MMDLMGLAGGALKFGSNMMRKADQEEEAKKQAMLGLHQKFQSQLGKNFTAVAPPPKENIGADILGAAGDMMGGGGIGNMLSGPAGQEFTPGQGWADKAAEAAPAPQPQQPAKITTNDNDVDDNGGAADNDLDDWLSNQAEEGRKDIYGNMARSYLG